MPIYDYQCQSCFEIVEVLQSLSEPDLEICPHCGGMVKKMANGSVGLIFKGSGFYITDYKNRNNDLSHKADKKVEKGVKQVTSHEKKSSD